MSESRLRAPSASTVIAAIALFIALGSGAYAASHVSQNSVGSKAIKKGAVKTKNIHDGAVVGRKIGDNQVKTSALKDGAVTTAKTSFISSGTFSSANATTANSPTDLGGPSVTVTVPSGGVIEVYALADISDTGGGASAIGKVDLLEPSLISTPEEILGSSANAFTRKYTTPGSNDFDGALNVTRSGWLTIPSPPGTYTFSLRYEADGGGTATFQNRILLVRVTR
jgi:hypothetical protein